VKNSKDNVEENKENILINIFIRCNI